MNKALLINSSNGVLQFPPPSCFIDGFYSEEAMSSVGEDHIFMNLFNQNRWDTKWCGLNNVLYNLESRSFATQCKVVFVLLLSIGGGRELQELIKLKKALSKDTVFLGLTVCNTSFALYPELTSPTFQSCKPEGYDIRHPSDSTLYEVFDGLIIPCSPSSAKIFTSIYGRPVFCCQPPIGEHYANWLARDLGQTQDNLAKGHVILPRPNLIVPGGADSILSIYFTSELQYPVTAIQFENSLHEVASRDVRKTMKEDTQYNEVPFMDYGRYLEALHQGICVVNFQSTETWGRSAFDSMLAGTPHVGNGSNWQQLLFPSLTVPYGHMYRDMLHEKIHYAIENSEKLVAQAKESFSVLSIKDTALNFDVFVNSIKRPVKVWK